MEPLNREQLNLRAVFQIKTQKENSEFTRLKKVYPYLKIKEEKDLFEINTHRSDVIDFLKSKFKDLCIYLKKLSFNLEVKQALEKAYENDQKEFIIPVTSWSSKFYKRYLALEKLKKKEKQVVKDYPSNVTLVHTPSEVKENLILKKWIYKTGVPGCYIYSPQYIALENALKQLYEKTVPPSKTQLYRFSPVVLISDLISSNYFLSCGEQTWYKFKLQNASSLRIKGHLQEYIDPKELFEKATGAHYALNYCSCHGLWPAFRNHNFKSETTNYFYDNTVPTYRNQCGKVQSLERLQTFNRFELVFLGHEKELLSEIDPLRERINEFFNSCNVPFQIQKGSAWYNEDSESEKGFTFDYIFRDSQEKEIEIGNLSYNDTTWTKSFNISVNNKTAYSGCSGIGIQRLIYVFLLANGFDFQFWPEKVKNQYQKNKINGVSRFCF